jgi:hypothetical protein
MNLSLPKAHGFAVGPAHFLEALNRISPGAKVGPLITISHFRACTFLKPTPGFFQVLTTHRTMLVYTSLRSLI